MILIDSDTAHILTRILMASTFIAASIFSVKSRNLGLACFYTISAVDTYAKFRYPFHDWARDFLLANLDGRFGKQEIQMYLIIGMGGMISIHGTDAFIYSIDGPFLRCGWIYAGAALLSTLGAIQLRSQGISRNRL